MANFRLKQPCPCVNRTLAFSDEDKNMKVPKCHAFGGSTGVRAKCLSVAINECNETAFSGCDSSPNTWNTLYDRDREEVSKYTEEFRQVEYELRQASNSSHHSIRRLIRVQNVHSYGQFLLREQLLVNDSSQTLYRVRRYIQVSRSYEDSIVKYNLDYRRCGLTTLTFQKSLGYIDSSQLVCVVVALTRNPSQASVSPSNFTDYYVEYIIEF